MVGRIILLSLLLATSFTTVTSLCCPSFSFTFRLPSTANSKKMAPSAEKPLEGQTLYFGYGSNLWLAQMHSRCPQSIYVGLARLPHYLWLINSRGYANVVQQSGSSASEVWGMVYTLTPEDEANLDINEGVPESYTKEDLDVDFWAANDTGITIDTENGESKMVKALVYIDRTRTEPDKPRTEYVYRMNRGIDDALRLGVPKKYVDDVMRKFIPADDKGGKETEEVRELAMRQMQRFDEGREDGEK